MPSIDIMCPLCRGMGHLYKEDETGRYQVFCPAFRMWWPTTIMPVMEQIKQFLDKQKTDKPGERGSQ